MVDAAKNNVNDASINAKATQDNLAALNGLVADSLYQQTVPINTQLKASDDYALAGNAPAAQTAADAALDAYNDAVKGVASDVMGYMPPN
ncbi:hypothetical protein WJX72_005770 [[Myrmecia] bisecta]|uniref:Lipoprotein n=1 Tax=[Myrmecia] bisecta TaxID=41462 RepID=A0AAW1QQQ5_9CHLO